MDETRVSPFVNITAGDSRFRKVEFDDSKKKKKREKKKNSSFDRFVTISARSVVSFELIRTKGVEDRFESSDMGDSNSIDGRK